MIPVSTLYDEYIDRRKLTEQKKPFEYIVLPPPTSGLEQLHQSYTLFGLFGVSKNCCSGHLSLNLQRSYLKRRTRKPNLKDNKFNERLPHHYSLTGHYASVFSGVTSQTKFWDFGTNFPLLFTII